MTELSALAFAGYKRLISVKLGQGLEKIDPSAFYGCSELVTITGGNGNYTAENNCIFDQTSKTVVLGCAGSAIPDEAETIGEYAFYAVKFKETSLTLPESVKNIGGHAFYATNLENLTVGSLQSVGSQAFAGNNLKELHINDLSAWCTAEFADSGSVSLDYCVIYVDGEQVSHNQNVLTIPDEITEIKPYAFWHSQITTVHLSAKTVKISEKAFAGSPSLNFITVEEGNPVYEAKSYGLFDKTTKTLLHGVHEKTSNAANVGSEVEHIAPYAFMYRLIYSLTLPSTLKDIGEYAFYGCRIKGEVVIHNGVTKIGEYAFADNTDLASVTIPSTVTNIGHDAFYQTGLTKAKFDHKAGWTMKHFAFGTTEIPDLATDESAAEELKKYGYIWTR